MKNLINPYFTSDTHWLHSHILKYQPNRGCSDIDELSELMIENWNRKVPKDADVFHCGDFGLFKKKDIEASIELITRLNGRIHLVKGNHDHSDFLKLAGHLFANVDKIMNIRVSDPDAVHGKQNIVLCHFPMMTWDRAAYGSWHLHGHSHGSLQEPFPTTRMDVGIDCHPKLEPFSYEEIKAYMSNRRYVPVDHHVQKEGDFV